MSVCTSKCMKTTADSKDKFNKNEIYIDISDKIIEYDIFDTDKSVVESNDYVKSELDITLTLNKMVITQDEKYIK